MYNSVLNIRITSLYGSPPSWLVFGCKAAPFVQITSLYGSQTEPVVLCMQNGVITTLNTCLYGSQLLSLVFACKTAPFGAELQVCIGPWPHLSFCACKTASLASELLISRGPSPRLWFLDAKQRLLYQNNESPWVPDHTCRFEHAKQRH